MLTVSPLSSRVSVVNSAFFSMQEGSCTENPSSLFSYRKLSASVLCVLAEFSSGFSEVSEPDGCWSSSLVSFSEDCGSYSSITSSFSACVSEDSSVAGRGSDSDSVLDVQPDIIRIEQTRSATSIFFIVFFMMVPP